MPHKGPGAFRVVVVVPSVNLRNAVARLIRRNTAVRHAETKHTAVLGVPNDEQHKHRQLTQEDKQYTLPRA